MRNNHNHNEAFCWMYYANKDLTKGYWIYNSRDGVTPFVSFINKEEFKHIAWSHDLYQPNYIPKEGDLVWTNITEEVALKSARKRVEMYPEYLGDRDKEEFIKSLAKDILGDETGPMLGVVIENGTIKEHH